MLRVHDAPTQPLLRMPGSQCKQSKAHLADQADGGGAQGAVALHQVRVCGEQDGQGMAAGSE